MVVIENFNDIPPRTNKICRRDRGIFILSKELFSFARLPTVRLQRMDKFTSLPNPMPLPLYHMWIWWQILLELAMDLDVYSILKSGQLSSN